MEVAMISKTRHRYGRQQLQVGDRFIARGQADARLLRALGRAEPEVATAIVVTEQETEPQETISMPVRQKRKYRRRDMVAE